MVDDSIKTYYRVTSSSNQFADYTKPKNTFPNSEMWHCQQQVKLIREDLKSIFQRISNLHLLLTKTRMGTQPFGVQNFLIHLCYPLLVAVGNGTS